MNRIKFALRLSLMACMACILGHAQTGTIQGTVTDKSGAVVQDADVVVTNLNTNQARDAKTGATGAFSVPSLTAGPYSITVTKGGFRAFKVDSVTLTVDQSLTVNASLEAGATSEEVQVRGDEIPPVDLQTAQISNIVESRQIQDLPLITRDPYSLVLLSPGTSQTNTSLGGFSVNGSRDRNNNFMLDGVDNNDTSVPGIPDGIISANPDSTQEFRVITNNFNAEYGRNTGAIIDVATKSGTNAFRGSVYEYGRWNSFGGARDWFNPRVDSSGTVQPMNPYTRNQFGFSIGGPIIKNKTFFFFNEEFQRFRTTLTNAVVAPTAAFRTGVFNYTGPDGTTQPVDLNGANNGFGLPADPTMAQLFALYPTPGSSSNGVSGLAFFPSSSRQDSYNPVVKIDHQFSQKHSVSMRYAYNHFFDPNPFHADILPNNVGGVSSKAIQQGVSANFTSTLTPQMINQFIFGWNKLYDTFNCTGTNVLDSISPLDRFGNGIDYLFGAPFTNFGCNALVSNGQWRKTGTTSFADNFTWVRGGHIFKFGGDFHNIGEQGPNSFFSRRELSLTTFPTQTGFVLINEPANDFCLDQNVLDCTLDEAAAAYYGFVGNDFNGMFFDKNGTRQATDNKHFRQHEYAFFGQDEWKVRRNLTLTLGLRYQLDGVPYEENANFSNLLQDPGSFQHGQDVVMTIVGPGTGHALYKQDYSNIEPRVGLSWDPWGDGKTAVRGGFGIFHDRLFGNLFGNARGNPPFEQDYNQFPFDTITNAFGGCIPSPCVPSVLPDTTPSAVIPDGSGLAPIIFDPRFRNPASNNWNFGIQRQLRGGNVLDVAYVASEAHHLFRQLDGNSPDPTLVNQLVAYCSNPANAAGCTPSQVSGILLYEGADFGIYPAPGVVTPSGNAVLNNAMIQPFYQRSVGNSVFNSLQVKFTHQMSHGLQAQVAYTWAHGIDDAPDPLAPAAGNRTFPRNSRDLAQERGNSDYDIRHIAVINYIWEVPFGRGKGVLNHGVVGRIFEGWQFAGITSIQTGHPFEIRCTRDSQRTGIGAWCDATGDPFAAGTNDDPSVNAGLRVWYRNPDAFTNPPFGRAGSIGRNQFYGPGLVDFDMSWTKNTKITERVGLKLVVQSYNIFNHPHFAQPDNLISDPTFGLISGTISRPDATTSARQMQVAVRLEF